MATKSLDIFIIFVFSTLSNYFVNTIEKPCREGYVCAPLSRCKLQSDELLFPCHNGLNYVCCPTNVSVSFISANIGAQKTDLFPDDCGDAISDDRISQGEKAYLGQFPWMALLGYRQNERKSKKSERAHLTRTVVNCGHPYGASERTRERAVKYVQFLCGGSIITDRYILTAAHCLHLGRNFELVLVRLGELNLTSEIDCIDLGRNMTDCGDRYLEMAIDNVITHEDFNSTSFKNDIALVRMRNPVRFTEYIRPICLPFDRDYDKKNFVNQNFTVSGWGKTSSVALGGSQELLYTVVTVWDQERCNNAVPPEVQPIQKSQICATGSKKEDACKGDSGGPLANLTRETDDIPRYIQIGVVSFSSTLVCGNPKLPTVYTRVDQYLEWILSNVS